MMGDATLRQVYYRWALEAGPELVPGMPEFLAHAPAFSPLVVPLGYDVSSGEGINWIPGQECNGTVLILGASGSGKTTALKVIGTRLAERAFPLLVLDFHGDVEFPGINTVLLSSGSACTVGINPMELDADPDGSVGLYDEQMGLLEMIKRAVPKLSHRQHVLLVDAIRETYQRAGIEEGNPTSWHRPPPTFQQVLQLLRGWFIHPAHKADQPSIPGCVASIRALFEHPLFQRPRHLTQEELLRGNLRLDLSKLSDDMRYVVAETVLRKVFRTLRFQGEAAQDNDWERFRLFILIDEAKILSMGKGDKNARHRILNLLATEGRKFGIGIILASQMVEHFSDEVRANASVWLVLKPLDYAEAKRNASNVSQPVEALMGLKGRGEGLWRSGRGDGVRRVQVGGLFSPG